MIRFSWFYSSIAILFLFCGSDLHGQIAVTDDLQRIITLPAPAKQVVSLAPSITETLFAIDAGDQVAGVTDYCNYPPKAKTKHRVGGVINPSIETIISLKPDLIIVSMEGNVREDFNTLVDLGVPVFVTNPRTFEGIHKSIRDIGALTGRREQAARLVWSMRKREDSIKAFSKEEKKKTLCIVSLQPLIVVGSKTFLSELLDLAGARNVAGSMPSTYPAISREAVIKQNPEVIIVMSDAVSNTEDLVSHYPEWKQLDAVRDARVFRIDSDLVSRPGPRAIDALATLFHLLHGEQK
jgi:iron complex transport system substrate-binding protein